MKLISNSLAAKLLIKVAEPEEEDEILISLDVALAIAELPYQYLSIWIKPSLEVVTTWIW